MAKKETKVRKPKRKSEADVLKHKGVAEGSLRFETEGKFANKQTVKRECANDRGIKTHSFKVATSDLFQKDACDLCMKHRRNERAKAKRAAKKAEREAAKAKEVKAETKKAA